MKDYLTLEKHCLPNHKERGFFNACKRAAAEHGYKGFLASWRFLYRRFADYFWQLLAFRAIPYSKIRVKVHRHRGVKIGKNVMIGPQVVIDDVFPNFVVIEDGVSLAANDYILTHSKPLEYHRNLTESYVAPVFIRKNAWIAINVTILPGVTIGEGSIVAAGSVVTKDVPPFCMVAGAPAKVIREFEMDGDIPIGFKPKKS